MNIAITVTNCQNLNRNGIGIELDKDYFDIATNRINTGAKQ
jgi:DNA modification methylase